MWRVDILDEERGEMMVELTEERVRQIVREEIREPLDQLERRFYEHINE